MFITEDQKRQERKNTAKALALGLGGANVLGGFGLAKYNKDFLNDFADVVKNSKQINTQDMNNLRTAAGLPNISITENPFIRNNAAFIPESKINKIQKALGLSEGIVYAPGFNKAPIIAHELGHAINHKTGRLARRIKLSRIGSLSGLAGILSSGYVVDALAKDKLSERDTVLAKAGLAGSAAGLGTLLSAHDAVKEEFLASKNALKLLKKTGLRDKNNVKALRKALSSYKNMRLLSPVFTFGSAAGTVGAWNWFKNRDRDKQ